MYAFVLFFIASASPDGIALPTPMPVFKSETECRAFADPMLKKLREHAKGSGVTVGGDCVKTRDGSEAPGTPA